MNKPNVKETDKGGNILNKWQWHYFTMLRHRRKHRSKIEKTEFALLGNVHDRITVHFPDFYGYKNQFTPAHNETYIVTFDECDIPKGKISVEALSGNLRLWTERGYRIEYHCKRAKKQ